jgi:gamma-glutamyltranspeptidase/glutathione hydrolase
MTAVAAAVAAGHPATADAGARILADGGTAADAAVAACFASCVSETVMTGLGGGGHAIHWDATRREAHLVDCFVNVPGLGAPARPGERDPVDIAFGSQVIRYDIGMGTVAVPGLVQGLAQLHARWGRVDWKVLLEPARRLAVDGVAMPPRHALTMGMIIESLSRDAGARIYTPGGRALQAGDVLHQPGLVEAFDVLADEGPRAFVDGSIARRIVALSDERNGLLTRDDFARYAVRVTPASRGVALGGHHVTARRDLAGFLDAVGRLPAEHAGDPARWAPAFADAFTGRDRFGDTTNLVAVDRTGNACVVTSSLGLGAGHYVPGLDVHLNSMLGETELLASHPRPGERMDSMMTPTLALDGRGRLAAAAGAAGGSRIRTALAQVLAGVLLEGVPPAEATHRARLHPAGATAHAEPGYPTAGLDALAAAGYRVQRWDEIHHFFGGASVVGAAGAGADPRRDGATAVA